MWAIELQAGGRVVVPSREDLCIVVTLFFFWVGRGRSWRRIGRSGLALDIGCWN